MQPLSFSSKETFFLLCFRWLDFLFQKFVQIPDCIPVFFQIFFKGAAYFVPNGALVDGNKVPVELEGWNFHWGPNFWYWYQKWKKKLEFFGRFFGTTQKWFLPLKRPFFDRFCWNFCWGSFFTWEQWSNTKSWEILALSVTCQVTSKVRTPVKISAL